MRVLTSTLDSRLEEVYDEFETCFGFGPCGAYAALRHEHGWGTVAVCLARTADGVEFPHFVILQDGDVIDLANPFDDELAYSELEALPDDELPDLVDDEVLAWMRKRISPTE